MKMRVQMSNQIRGLLETFGLVVPNGSGSVFERNVILFWKAKCNLACIILPLLKAWSDIRLRVAELTKQLVVMAGADQRCRLLTSVPGVGTATATAFAAAVEDSVNFKNSRAVGAWIGKAAVRRAPSTLLHRTRIVDRLFERLAEIGAIHRNPVAALRDECNIKQCMPIWRALASRNPEEALAGLRQPRQFGSVLGECSRNSCCLHTG